MDKYFELRAKDVLPWCIHHGVTVSLYYADPDGSQMEFRRTLSTASKAPTAHARTALRDQPDRRGFDPRAMLAKLRAGIARVQLWRAAKRSGVRDHGTLLG
jgi:hypothetical protein